MGFLKYIKGKVYKISECVCFENYKKYTEWESNTKKILKMMFWNDIFKFACYILDFNMIYGSIKKVRI